MVPKSLLRDLKMDVLFFPEVDKSTEPSGEPAASRNLCKPN